MIVNTKTLTHNFYEHQAWAAGQLVCGIDEAGRGCLAGPVVAGAVILPAKTTYKLLRDSKTLSASQREQAFEWITENAAWQACWASVSTIDEVNIYQATKRTMLLAASHLFAKYPQQSAQTSIVTIDAMPLEFSASSNLGNLEVFSFNYGESFSASIAAASIVAKVTRDQLMTQLAKSFPAYGFEQHKGYGTIEHTQEIKINGASIAHRKSFLGNILSDKKEQLSFF